MRINDENIEYLFKCIVSLDSIEECESFFIDLCSESELDEMSKRIKAARMLKEGYPYTEITAQTKLSTATISRVKRAIKTGNDGYSKIFEKLKNAES